MGLPSVPKSVPKVRTNASVLRDFITKDGKVDLDKFIRSPKQEQLLTDSFKAVRNYLETGKNSPEIDVDSAALLLDAAYKIYYPDLSTTSRYTNLVQNKRKGIGISNDELNQLKETDIDTYNVFMGNKNAEPTTGALSNAPINTTFPAGTPQGALTNPLPKVPENNSQAASLNVGKTPEEAAAKAYTGKESTGVDYTTPQEVQISFNKEPVTLSPEAIGEAMRTAVKENASKDAATAASPETMTKVEAEAKGTETKAPETEVETPTKSLKGMLKNTWDFLGNHKKLIAGAALLGGVGIPVASKIAKALNAGEDTRRTRKESVPSDNTNYRVWENYIPYEPGRIPDRIPQDNLPSSEELTIVKENKGQPQIVSTPAPENNATADYVKAAYNSYIPSDAGRAYQKAIYGDPLELERNRLQQKWRDFVMRSGQSPSELVQRGLMPYDALQYI